MFGAQKTLRCSDGTWTVNSVLANPVTRMASNPSSVFVGSRKLAVDVASAVVQDMLNEGDIDPDPLHIRVASRAAVKEVFERADFPIKEDTQQYENLRHEMSRWREAPSELALVDIMGGLRSRVVTSDVGTLRGNGSSSIWRNRDTTHILTAMQHITHNDSNLYQGTDGHLTKRLLRTSFPPKDMPVINLIEQRCPTHPKSSNFSNYHSLGIYLLRVCDQTDPMYHQAHLILGTLHSINEDHFVALAGILKVMHRSAKEDHAQSDTRPNSTILRNLTAPGSHSSTRETVTRLLERLQQEYLPDHPGQASPTELLQAGWRSPYGLLRLHR